MHPTLRVTDRLRYNIIPAVPVPFRVNNEIDLEAHTAYMHYLRRQPIGGVAVWAHTGRGLHLKFEERAFVLQSWREALPEKIIIAGVGGAPDSPTREEYFSSAMAMAEHAAQLGADAFLIYPPTPARNLPPHESEKFIFEYYTALASFNIPIILFYLYEAAGGINFSNEIIAELALIEQVIGMKLATADSVMTYQRIAILFAKNFPEKLLITGEDRFFGYSLMCGAQSALVGMGSACTGLQAAMMNAYFHEAKNIPIPSHPETERFAKKSFLELSSLVDQFGVATFAEPLQGYIRRMLWALVELGVIDDVAAHDPWGPELSSVEQEEVRRVVKELMSSE